MRYLIAGPIEMMAPSNFMLWFSICAFGVAAVLILWESKR